MSDIVNNLELIPIESVSLSESEVGRNINDRFSNIDKNFQSIIDSEYLKGQTGDGIYTKECSFEKGSSEGLGIYKDDQLLTSGKLYQLISECILTGVEYQGQLSNGRIPNGKIILIYQNNDGKNILISSLPYVFIDKVYLESLRVEDENGLNPNVDLSCILYFENNDFVKSSTIPKIYYDDVNATFCWNINGVPTQLPAQGPRGIDGKPGTSVYYAKCENRNGKYILTSVYEQGSFKDNSTLEKGTIVMAYVTNINPTDIIIGVIDKDTNGNTNVITEPVELNIPNISVLMKNNDSNSLYVTIPGTDESISGLYHKISSITTDTDYVLKMGVVDENNIESTINNDILISEYSNNTFNGNVSIDGVLIAEDENNQVYASHLIESPKLQEWGENPNTPDSPKQIQVVAGKKNI